MSYTYRDLFRDINKIPEHRLDSTITTSVDPNDGDTYYVLSREEITEEQNMPKVNRNETGHIHATNEAPESEYLTKEIVDSVLDLEEEQSYDEPLVLGEHSNDDDFLLGPVPDLELALLDVDETNSADAASAALKTPEDWTATAILDELGRLGVETKIDGFSLKFKPVKNVPDYLKGIIKTKELELICQIRENQTKREPNTAELITESESKIKDFSLEDLTLKLED